MYALTANMGEGLKVTTFLTALWVTSIIARPDDLDLDSLITGTFGKPPGQSGDGYQPTVVGGDGYQPPDNGNKEPGFVGGNETPTDCECVPYYLCNNGTINDDGTGIIDIRFGEGTCESYIDECCKTPPLPQPITPAPIVREGCGFRNEDGIGFRITGAYDNEAQYGEFPWMIAILREEKVEDGNVLNVYQCGGSLIHPKVVLTAAHCVVSKDKNLLKARGGEWDTQMTTELYPHQDRKVDHIVVHEKYYAGALYNDVALLILDHPYDHAQNLDIICLPKQGDVILDQDCFASGWGKDTFGKEGQYQVILKKIELPMVQRDICQDALRKTRLGNRFKLHDSFVCAGGIEGRDTCKGDGGSPLVCPVKYGKEHQYQQVGIVAWGIGCGNKNPAVYVNVAHFVNWIDAQMAKHGIQPGYYY